MQVVTMIEGAKSDLREVAVDLAARVLRAGGWHAAALQLDRAGVGALRVNRETARDVCALVSGPDVLARSVRRAALRFGAAKLRGAGCEWSGAAGFLELLAGDGRVGSYVLTGLMSAVPCRSIAVPCPHDEF